MTLLAGGCLLLALLAMLLRPTGGKRRLDAGEMRRVRRFADRMRREEFLPYE